ncbi:phage tail protein [Janthinobacterium sp.]|uniref:phage tail protein n=1 Tax=Janthinobacterium sp. TaxID=1871054 RepID=UPI00258A27C8|nr:phage tail protein [Janthinobacterium sp.]MCX7290641.1 phage tail protein [Janthinobacterium sp.]
MSAPFHAPPPFPMRPGVGDTPVGAVIAFAGATAGAAMEAWGWMLCDGRMLDCASYPELYAALGYLYGGSGGQFQLPDYRGCFLRGHDGGASVSAEPGQGAGALPSDAQPKSADVSYLIKFTYGMGARSPFPA